MERQLISSTSSSERASRKQSELACIGIALGVLIVTVGAFFAINRVALHLPPNIAANARPPQSPEYYLAYFRGGVENYAFYDNMDGIASQLRHADVLLLGNSRMFYAMRNQKVLSDYFSKLGLSYYVMAFGYDEGESFPAAILRKYDLHPKWVIVDADPFFGVEASSFASKVMSEGRFDAFKFRLETNLTYEVERRVHRLAPYLGMSQWGSDQNRQADWIYYRSKADGTMRLLSYQGRIQAYRRLGANWTDDQVEAAKQFNRELQLRGSKLVLTHVPPSEGEAAANFGAVLGVPVISLDLPGLHTFDGSHLDDDSAKRYSSALLSKFAEITANVPQQQMQGRIFPDK